MHTAPSGQALLSHPEQAELCDAAEGDGTPESQAGHQLQARVLMVPSIHPCLLQLAQARSWKLSRSLSSGQAAAASLSGEGLALTNTDHTEAVQRRARYSHIQLTQHQDLHPAGSTQSPGETLTQQPGQGQDTPSCLFYL